MESRNGVASMSRKHESRNGVAKMSCEEGVTKIKKFGGVCNGYPEGRNKIVKNNVQNR